MFARAVFISLVFFSIPLPVSAQESKYVFYLESDSISLNMFLDILYDGLDENIRLEVKQLERLNRGKCIYGVLLADNATHENLYLKNNILSHVISNMLPEGEALWLKLTRNSRRVLIADARKRTIDVSDISMFKVRFEEDGAYLSAAILLHELYEQFHIQHIARAEPRQVTSFQIAEAHAHANQREGNYYHRNLQKDVSKVYPGFILIRFNNLADGSSVIYRAYYKRGNIYRVETEYL